MWVLKRREGSINYIMTWAVVALLLAVGLLAILLPFLYHLADISTIVDSGSVATTSLVVGIILLLISIPLMFRQGRQLARFRRLNQMRQNVRSGLRLAESLGVDTERAATLYNMTQAQVGFKDLRKTEKVMAECYAVLESQLTLQTDKLLEKTKARMELKRDSTGILFSNESLAPIEQNLEKGDYWEVSKLLRSHNIASERIEAVWFALRKAKKLGIPIEIELAQLKDVLNAFNSGDFIKSRVGAIKVRDSLNTRIKSRVKERYVGPVYDKIKLMENRGIVADDAQMLISQAATNLLAGNLEGTLKLARSSDETINEMARSSIQESFDAIDGITERAQRMGVDVSFVPPRMDIAREDLEAGRLEKSLGVLKNIEMSLVKNMNFLVVEQFQTLKNGIDTLFLVPEAKLELTSRLEEAEARRKEGDFEEAMKVTRKLSERINNEEKESLRAYKKSTKKIMEKMKDLEEKGVSTKKIKKAVKISKERAEDKNFAKAMEIVLNVTEIVDRNLTLYKDSVRTLEELSTLLTRTKEQGADVSDLVERMKALEGVPEPEQVLAQAKEIEELALQRMTDMTERTQVELAKLRDQLHSLLEKGVDAGEGPKLIGEAEKSVKDGEFTRADMIIAKARKVLEGCIELSERFDDLIAQITETFVSLERAGIPTNVFESDLQHMVTERNEDSLEELTRFLDDVRSEEERVKSQARETIEDSSILVSENPDISFVEESEIIASAIAAYDEGKYSKAFEIAVEAVGRTQKKIELFEFSTQLCDNLDQDIERLGVAGFDISGLESELQICEMEADPNVRLERVRALEAEVDKTETKLRQKMEWAMVEARHGITLLEMNEVSQEDLTEMLDSARALAEEGRTRDAEKKARNVHDLAEKRIGQFRDARARMAALEHIMNRAREMDVSLAEYEEDYSWLQKSDDYSHIIEKAGLIHDQINNLFEDRRDDVRASISRLRDGIAELEGSGIRAPSVIEAIDKAELEISGDQIIEAMDTINLAEERMQEVKESYGRWSEVLSTVEDALREATESGIGVKDFRIRVDALIEAGEYVSGIPELDEILDDLDSRKTTMTTRSLEDIQTTREKLEGLIEEGAPGGELMEMLKVAERSVQEEEYTASRQKILEVIKATEQLKNDHESFLTVLNQVKTEVDEVVESGFDMTEILAELEAVRNSEDDYRSRIQLVRDLGVRASSLAESLSLEASQVISETKALLRNLRSEGMDVKGAEEMLSDAKEKMGEGNTFEAKRLALEAKTIAEETARLAGERNGEYARAKEAISKAEAWGVDASGLKSDLDDAIHLSVGPESLQKLRMIIEEADSLRLSLSEDAGARLDGLRMDIQDLKAKGMSVSNLDAVIRSAENMMGEGKLTEANELLEALQEQKSEMEILWSDYSDAKQWLDAELGRLEVKKTDADSVQKDVSKILALGVTRAAVEEMEALIERVIDVKKKLRESTEERLEEVRDYVNQLGEKGVDVEEALTVIYEAEEVLAEDSYLRALAKINRAAYVGEKMEQRHTFENKILETEELLKVANEEGVDVADLMDRMENLKDGEDFDAMTETLTSIEKETNKRRNGLTE